MIKHITLILIIVSVTQVYSQDLDQSKLDSLYNLFAIVRGIDHSDRLKTQFENDPELIKCGFGLVNTVKQYLNTFSVEQQNVLSKLLDRPANLSNTAVSSNGFFRVHYTTTGNDAIGYDLNLLLAALDSVYNFEIISLGFMPPPLDDAYGGDNKYDIYILNISDYGYTQPESRINNSSWTSFMVIDNDYPVGSFYTHGINAARVTVAHEFHHAIQMGNYAPANINSAYRNSDIFFYELAATAFEEFVFDNVNDYYAYMPSYFSHPEFAMPNQNGYNLAIWNIYLQKNFGFEVIKRQWELMPTNDALRALALSLNERGSNLGNELNKFGIWTYFTNSRTINGRYFDEAEYYPLITPTANITFTPSSKNYSMTLAPAANYFLKINLPLLDGIFYTIVTNSDWQRAIENPNQAFPFSYSVFDDTIVGEQIISDKYSAIFSESGKSFWNNAGILNDIVIYGDSNYSVTSLEGDTYAFPMPFRLSSHDYINIDFQSDLNIPEIDLNIYSAGLELYYSGKKSVQPPYLKDSKRYRRITLNQSDTNFSSGVYIYVIKSGDDIYKGKLVIFND